MEQINSREIFNQAIEALNNTELGDDTGRQKILKELVNLLLLNENSKLDLQELPVWISH